MIMGGWSGNIQRFINGKAVTEENIEAFAKEVLNDVHARDSWRAAKDFREHIAVESAKRALREAVRRSGGEI